MNIRALVTALIFLTSPAAYASEALPSPQITAKAYGGTENTPLEAPIITKMDLEVEINGHYAQTRAIVTFVNPNDLEIETDVVFDLPAQTLLTGYGLDINGTLVDSVIVEKKHAKKVFEDRIREGVDPGLAEITRDNAFKTRIFPVAAEQARIFSVQFLTPISKDQPIHFPFSSEVPIEQLTLKVKSTDSSAFKISFPEGMEENAAKSENGTITREVFNTSLSGAITISKLENSGPYIEEFNPNQYYFSARIPSTQKQVEPTSIKSIRVFWDTSLSQEASSQGNLEAIKKLTAPFTEAQYDLVLFSTTAQKLITQLDASELVEEIETITYHGATNLERAFSKFKKYDKSDLCILMTDGDFTLGNFPKASPKCTLFTASASPHAQKENLEIIAKANGGRHISLTGDAQQLEKSLLSWPSDVHSIFIDNQSMKNSTYWSDNGEFVEVIVPTSPNDKTIRANISGKAYNYDLTDLVKTEGKTLAKMWANNHIARIRSEGALRDELVTASQAFGVATRETSMLVLEEIDDYVENGIPLPQQGFNKEQKLEYATLKKERDTFLEEEKSERASYIQEQWDELL